MTRDKWFSACYVPRSKMSTLAKNVATNFCIRWKQHLIGNQHDSKPTVTGRKIEFKQICNWSKYDANLGLQIWPKFEVEAMMMRTQISIPVVFAHKCEVNMIPTLHLLHFWYLRKSTNLTCIYTDLLSLQSITFAFSTKSRQTWYKSICLHHCFTNVTEASN